MSRNKCCVPGCLVTKDDGIPLHRFPNFALYPDRYLTWVSCIDSSIHELDETYVYNNLRVCRKHFKAVDLYPNNHLYKLAVPELLLSGHDQQETEAHFPSTSTPLAETLLPSTSAALRRLECTAAEAEVMRIQLDHNYSGHEQQIMENVPSTSTPRSDTTSLYINMEQPRIAETLLPSTSAAQHHLECAVVGAEVMRDQLQHTDSGHDKQETEAHFPSTSTPLAETLLPSTSAALRRLECTVAEAEVMRIQLDHNYSGHEQQIMENVPSTSTPRSDTTSLYINMEQPRIAETLLPSTSAAQHHLECAVVGAEVMRDQLQHTDSDKSMKRKARKVTKQIGRLLKKSKQSSSLLKKIVVLRNKLKVQKDQVKAAHKMSKTILFRKVLKSLPITTQTFINMQLTQHGKKNRGRRFSLDDKLLALSIYKKSPKGYNFLRKLFTLPSKRTLQEVLKLTTIKPGLNPVIFGQLKEATEGLVTEKRLCVLMFDEMALAPSMHYSTSSDQIIGFENLGDNDITGNIADHVLVMMVKGIHAKWKQPIYYGFCKNATKAVILKKIIKQVIIELFDAGLIVVATVCDQSKINVKVVNDLIEETRVEYIKANKEFRYNAFEILDNKIFPLFDAPHLLKCIRNNLLAKDLRFIQDDKVKTAKWEHLKLLLDIDCGDDDLRMCNKLTEAHVLPDKMPKMKVKHAAQVFSQRVSENQLLPQECCDTADLLLFFDQLFDSFNGGSYKPTYKIYKNCVKENSVHFTLWNKAVPILRSMGFCTQNKRKDGSNSITFEKVPTITNWIHNINSVKDLWQYLSKEYKVTSLLLRNLNQDPVENFFSSVRSHGARNTNPTCIQFESIYKTLIVNNLSSSHSLGANCEEDANKMLRNLDILLTKSALQAPRNDKQAGNDCEEVNLVGSSSEAVIEGGTRSKNDELIIETKKYVAGYVIKKTKVNICKSCTKCNNELCDTTPPHANSYILSIDMTKRSLQYPSQDFSRCVQSIIKIIKHILTESPHESSMCEKIKVKVENIVNFDFLSCDVHKDTIKNYVIKLLMKLIINSWCNNVNRILKGRHLSHDNDKIKLQALEYYKTHHKKK